MPHTASEKQTTETKTKTFLWYLLLSYDPYGPARNFLGKPYEKKSRMRAVHLALAGPEKAVRPY